MLLLLLFITLIIILIFLPQFFDWDSRSKQLAVLPCIVILLTNLDSRPRYRQSEPSHCHLYTPSEDHWSTGFSASQIVDRFLYCLSLGLLRLFEQDNDRLFYTERWGSKISNHPLLPQRMGCFWMPLWLGEGRVCCQCQGHSLCEAGVSWGKEEVELD